MPASPPFNVCQQRLLHWGHTLKKLFPVSVTQLAFPIIKNCIKVTQFDHIYRTIDASSLSFSVLNTAQYGLYLVC